MKLGIKKVIIGLLGVFFIWTLWPLGFLLQNPSFLWQKHLLIFMNEAETRPCGGFVTAFGEIQAWPPRFNLKNAYHLLDADFGPAPSPLDRVSPRLKFWDLGFEADPERCSQRFAESYASISDHEIKQTWLINTKPVETLFKLVSPLTIEDQIFTSDTFFAQLSRSVANVDRHNAIVLQNRKKPLSQIGKKIISKLILTPWKWPQATRLIRDNIQSGDIYNTHFSQAPSLLNPPAPNSLLLSEWNLGGGKSSRSLHKRLTLNFYQVDTHQWEARMSLLVEHLGGYDEPLSQDYKGQIEITLTKEGDSQTQWLDVALKPGEKITFDMAAGALKIDHGFTLSVPRGQTLFLDARVSSLPQQVMQSQTLEIKEGVGTFYSKMQYPGITLDWTLEKDTFKPFVTHHEVIDAIILQNDLKDEFETNDLVAEIHFNEEVSLMDKFKATLSDTNTENAQTDDPQLSHYKLLPDHRTLLLGFKQKNPQINEHFSLRLEGLKDRWDNLIDSDMTWTLIPR